MIRAKDAVETARTLIGTPYDEMDCIAMIRTVIKKSPGGVSGYRCTGTNWLWKSIENSGKYRHLISRQEGTAGARAGMLAFKRSGGDVHHVGLVTGAGTVIHASSAAGCVVETELDGTWHLLGEHRYIEPGQEELPAREAGDDMEAEAMIRLTDEAGNQWTPVGGFRAEVFLRGND